MGESSDQLSREELSAAFARARDAHPGVAVTEAAFTGMLATRLESEAAPREALRALRLDDLYLALGCAAGDAAALAWFERAFVPEMRPVLARMGLPTADADEALQMMREELFAPAAGKRPLVLSYAGRGPLRTWLRTVAGRLGLRVVKARGKNVPLTDSFARHTHDDLELEYLKKRYGAAFKAAFEQSLAELDLQDRLLLKQRLRHNLSIEQLGALHRVHPATISRRVTAAREQLVVGTRQAMMRTLNLGRVEVSSILRLIRSELDISLSTDDMPKSDAG